jgi:hypothetical protein
MMMCGRPPVPAAKALPIVRASSSVLASRTVVMPGPVRFGISSGSSVPPCGAVMMIGRSPAMYSM